MNKPNKKDQKYFTGHIFLDQSFMNDVDKYISFKEEQNKELIEVNESLHGGQALLLSRIDDLHSNEDYEKLESQLKELIEENNGIKIQARALQDAVNELQEHHEETKQQNVDVHNEWKELNDKNKELSLCLENSTKIMEEQEGEVMDLVICETMNHQIRWNRETLETNKI